MATKQVYFEVTTKASACWIAVGDKDVPLVNGKGSINLAVRDKEHTVIWWFVGNPGTALTLVGKDSHGKTLVEVKESKIPTGRYQAVGFRRFKVK